MSEIPTTIESNLGTIKPNPANPRRISKEALAQLCASIERDPQFMVLRPIVVDNDNVVLGGNQRLTACIQLGMSSLPDGWVVRATDLTPEQRKRFVVVDNAPEGMSGEWNWEQLINSYGVKELEDLAFCPKEINLHNVLDIIDDESVPAMPDTATTRRGDIWILGTHRLMCGDSASETDLDALLDGATIDLVNTDPPYNVNVEPRSATAIAAGNSGAWGRDWKKIAHHQSFDKARGACATPRDKVRPRDRPLANDFMTEDDFNARLNAWFSNLARVLKKGGSFYIWGGYANLANYPPALDAAGLYFSQGIIWDKQHPVLTRKDYMGAFEICFYGWRVGAGHNFYGPNNETDLWHVKKVNPQDMVHLTEKPVELAAKAIHNSTTEGQNVLDLFGGSGSTLIACQQTKRRAFLMELDELYCDVIVARWEKLTGLVATRIETTNTEAGTNERTEENSEIQDND